MIRPLLFTALLLSTSSFIALPALAGKEGVPASAQMPAASPISITDAYAFATAEGQPTGAVFMKVANTGDGDRLLSAQSSAAKTVELHEHVMEGDVMGMRKVDSIALSAQETMTLQPMGYHIMLIDLTAPLVAGQTLPLSLTFEKAGTLEVTATIVPPGTAPGMGAPPMDHMHHHMMMSPEDSSKSGMDHEH